MHSSDNGLCVAFSSAPYGTHHENFNHWEHQLPFDKKNCVFNTNGGWIISNSIELFHVHASVPQGW